MYVFINKGADKHDVFNVSPDHKVRAWLTSNCEYLNYAESPESDQRESSGETESVEHGSVSGYRESVATKRRRKQFEGPMKRRHEDVNSDQTSSNSGVIVTHQSRRTANCKSENTEETIGSEQSECEDSRETDTGGYGTDSEHREKVAAKGGRRRVDHVGKTSDETEKNNWTVSNLSSPPVHPSRRRKQIESSKKRSQEDVNSEKTNSSASVGATLLSKRPYTQKEHNSIVQYIVENNAYAFLRGKILWQRMELEKVCERSWQSMKEQFRRKIYPVIRHIDIPQEEKEKICESMQCPARRKSCKAPDPGNRGWRRNANFYSIDEDKKVIEYLLANKRFRLVRQAKVWKDMERKNILPGRTWQSLQNRFKKFIAPNIKIYDLTSEDMERLDVLSQKGSTEVTDEIFAFSTPKKSVYKTVRTAPNKSEQRMFKRKCLMVALDMADKLLSPTKQSLDITSSSSSSTVVLPQAQCSYESSVSTGTKHDKNCDINESNLSNRELLTSDEKCCSSENTNCANSDMNKKNLPNTVVLMKQYTVSHYFVLSDKTLCEIQNGCSSNDMNSTNLDKYKSSPISECIGVQVGKRLSEPCSKESDASLGSGTPVVLEPDNQISTVLQSDTQIPPVLGLGIEISTNFQRVSRNCNRAAIINSEHSPRSEKNNEPKSKIIEGEREVSNNHAPESESSDYFSEFTGGLLKSEAYCGRATSSRALISAWKTKSESSLSNINDEHNNFSLNVYKKTKSKCDIASNSFKSCKVAGESLACDEDRNINQEMKEKCDISEVDQQFSVCSVAEVSNCVPEESFEATCRLQNGGSEVESSQKEESFETPLLTQTEESEVESSQKEEFFETALQTQNGGSEVESSQKEEFFDTLLTQNGGSEVESSQKEEFFDTLLTQNGGSEVESSQKEESFETPLLTQTEESEVESFQKEEFFETALQTQNGGSEVESSQKEKSFETALQTQNGGSEVESSQKEDSFETLLTQNGGSEVESSQKEESFETALQTQSELSSQEYSGGVEGAFSTGTTLCQKTEEVENNDAFIFVELHCCPKHCGMVVKKPMTKADWDSEDFFPSLKEWVWSRFSSE